MAGHQHKDEPQVRCGMPTGADQSGPPCQNYRKLSLNCPNKLHARTVDDLERVALEYCERLDIPLPPAFAKLEQDRQERRLEWLTEFKLGGCTDARAAAIAIGITQDPAEYGRRQHGHYKPEIEAWWNDHAESMGAAEVVHRKVRTARNIPSQYLVPVNPDDPDDRSMTHDIRAMCEAGDGDQIIGIDRDAKGNLVYSFASSEKAQSEIIDIHGLKKFDKNVTRWTDAQLIEHLEKMKDIDGGSDTT